MIVRSFVAEFQMDLAYVVLSYLSPSLLSKRPSSSSLSPLRHRRVLLLAVLQMPSEEVPLHLMESTEAVLTMLVLFRCSCNKEIPRGAFHYTTHEVTTGTAHVQHEEMDDMLT